MQNKEYPKVFILLEPFNDSTGMGVTMTNLFKNWPRDRIAIAANYLDVDLCERIRPCFSYLALSRPPVKQAIPNIPNNCKVQVIKSRIRDGLKDMYMKAGGGDLRKLPINEKLLQSIDKFHPDIIFTALGSLDRIRYVEKILAHASYAKLAVYIVDDWPNTKQNGRWFPGMWRRKYDKALRGLLSRTDYFFTICQAMSDSYFLQYGKSSVPFHNPVDLEKWKSVDVNRRFDRDTFSIVYVGKINRDTKDTISNLASAVTNLNIRGYKTRFDVYSPSTNDLDITKYIGFRILSPVANSEIPSVLKSYDSLFLTLGFSKISRDYTKLSMPTKLTEYLSAGVPILLNAPAEIAVTKYVRNNNVALICDSEKVSDLETCLERMSQDIKLRTELVSNALSLAERHDVCIVREQFRKALSL